MTRVYVGNVSTKGDLAELKELFGDCGKVKHFDIKEGSGYIVQNYYLLLLGIWNTGGSRWSYQKIQRVSLFYVISFPNFLHSFKFNLIIKGSKSDKNRGSLRYDFRFFMRFYHPLHDLTI